MASPLLPAVLIGALFWWLGRRGDAPTLAPFDPADTDRALDAICAAGSSVPATPRGLAALVLADAYPSASWPPRLGASASHAAVWRDGLAWAESLIDRAGPDVCAYLEQGGDAPSLGTFVPVPPPPAPSTFQPAPTLPQAGIVPGLGLPPVASSPTPGQRYQIQYGDTLLSVAGRAYQIPAGPGRLAGAVKINDGQLAGSNVRFSMPGTPAYNQSVGNLASSFPNGVISFGVPFQIIYIPA